MESEEPKRWVWVPVMILSSGGFSRPLGVFTSKKGAKSIKYRPGQDPGRIEIYKMEVKGDPLAG